MSFAPHNKLVQTGFTLVELITIIIILGILSVVALPRFLDRGTFDNRAFNDQIRATLRAAQKLAIAQHRAVCAGVSVATPATLTISVSNGGVCNTLLAERTVTAAGEASLAAPSANTTITFDAMGSPGAASAVVQAAGEQPIVIEAETGYVH
jgi:MSHA pilin protein MshC